MEVFIEKLDHHGRGIAHKDGKIIFVEGALPDEVVDVRIVKSKKNYDEAIIDKYIKKSKFRIESVCPYYKDCGGCDLLHLEYNEQLKYKENKIKEIIQKYANIDMKKIHKIVPSPKNFNYRNKISLKNNGVIGYYKKRTNEIINVKYCYLANESINNTVKELNEKAIDSEVTEIIIRDINNNDKSLTLSLQDAVIDKEKYEKEFNCFDNVNVLCNNKTLNLKGKSNIIGKLSKKSFEISPTAFFQINTEQTINLYERILEEIKRLDYPKVLDLYCGTGTIGIYVSDYASSVLGVEINPKSIEDAKTNKKLNNANNVDFIVGDAKKVLCKNEFKADVVIVDPPRAGLDKSVIYDLIKINPTEIIYVSCDPVTLARDLNIIKKYYEVEKIIPFDMFPNTYHVESVILLQRKD